MEFNLVQTLAIYALPVIFAITLHEAAHGYVARHFGDNTAYVLGRVSLNPVRHIDLVGTILVPLLILVSTIAAHLPSLRWLEVMLSDDRPVSERLAVKPSLASVKRQMPRRRRVAAK